MAKRDRRRTDIAKFLEVYRGFGAPEGSAAEQAIWVILARHGTKEGATRALKALWRRYVDVNELRVAKATEIASLIQRNVKNDAIAVASQVRGFLRRWHKDQHTIEFAAAERMTPDQARKYLISAEGFGREMALALFLHFCAAEIEAEEAVAVSEGKPKKRPEKDVTVSANRLRLFASFSAFGKASSRSVPPNAARALAKAWSYAPLPAEPGPKRSAKKKKTTAKKATKKTAKKGGGAARPRTTRSKTKRRTSKKSSRR